MPPVTEDVNTTEGHKSHAGDTTSIIRCNMEEVFREAITDLLDMESFLAAHRYHKPRAWLRYFHDLDGFRHARWEDFCDIRQAGTKSGAMGFCLLHHYGPAWTSLRARMGIRDRHFIDSLMARSQYVSEVAVATSLTVSRSLSV